MPSTVTNSYTYAGNSPTLYTDPTGSIFGIDDLLFIGIFALAGSLGNWIFTGATTGNWSPIHFLTGALKGLAFAAAIVGVGHLVGAIGGLAAGAGNAAAGTAGALASGLWAPSVGAQIVTAVLASPAFVGTFFPNAGGFFSTYADVFSIVGGIGNLFTGITYGTKFFNNPVFSKMWPNAFARHLAGPYIVYSLASVIPRPLASTFR